MLSKAEQWGTKGKRDGHARLSPSSMDRWSVCAASVRLSEGIPNTTSSYAEEGTRMHGICADVLNGKPWPAPTNISEDAEEHCRVYTDYVQNLVKATGGKLFVEQHISAEKIDKDVFGTADAIVYDEKNSRLHIIDFKYGAGIAVESEGNKQMRCYALGALLTFSDFRVDEIEITIVQPRAPHTCGPIRSETLSALGLLRFAGELRELAERTRNPKALFATGDHCRFCPAAGICTALSAKATELALTKFESKAPYVPEKLAEVLDRLPLLEDWIKSVREFAFNELNAGKVVPHWKLVPKRAQRKWTDESVVKYNLEALGYGILDYTETKLKSPAQVEKLLGTRNKTILESLVIQESSGLTLAPESDKREAANRQAVAVAAFSVK